MGFFNLRLVEQKFKLVPLPVRKFLLKAIFLYVGWVAFYHLYLEPKHIVDPALTKLVGVLTYHTAQLLYPHHLVKIAFYSESPTITLENSGIGILDGCNGLELFVFYIGFIICFSGPLKLALKYIVAGCIGIFVLNIIRCVALLSLSYIKFRYIDSFHHYVFTIVVYGFIFLLWLSYLKKSLQPTNLKKHPPIAS